MSPATGFDVILLGYRNDLAQARTREFLLQQRGVDAHLLVEEDADLPLYLYRNASRERSLVLRAQLEPLGAQVVVRAAAPEEPPATGPTVRPRRPRLMALVPLLVVALAAGNYWLHPVARLPAAPPLVRVRAMPVQQEVAPLSEPVTMQSAPAPAPVSQDPEAIARNNEAVRFAQTGQFVEAIDELEAALRDAPDDALLLHNLQTILLNWGVADLAADRVNDAISHLERAAELGERVEILQALGVALMRRGDAAGAAPLLERALEIAPKDSTTLLALADAYQSLDRRADALDILHRARESGLHAAEIDKRVQQLSREVDAEWDFVQVQDPHFRVSFAGDQDDTAVRIILDALADAYDAVGGKFSHFPDGRTPVVLYTQQDFHAITQTPDWAGGAFDGRIKIPVRGLTSDDPQLHRVVRHEYAHNVVSQLAGPRCPVWLNEGLAVWAEELDDGERVPWAEERIGGQPLFALDQLNTSFVSVPRNRIDVAYAQSYLAVRMLIDQYGARRIPDLLKALGRYGNLNDAFADVYHENFSKFEQRLFRQLAG